MRIRKIVYLLSSMLVSVVACLIITFEMDGGRPAKAQAYNFVSGTGTFATQDIRCRIEFLSDCGDDNPATQVSKTVRETSLNECAGNPTTTDPAGAEYVEYSGFVSNAKEDGSRVIHSINSKCGPNPNRSHSEVIAILDNATVTDPETGDTWTGGLEITSQVYGEGDIVNGDPSSVVITRAVSKIVGTSGDLEGARGEGTADGIANFAGTTTIYSYTIRIPNY